MRGIFFGSSQYCIPLLETLCRELLLAAVITQPDKPVGRKKILTPSAPKQFAKAHDLPVFTPGNKKELSALTPELSKLDADIAIVADYGMIIPEEIFAIPKHKTINVHFSKLPQLRGASPVQHTILSGSLSAWITIQILEKALDTGDILWQKEHPMEGNETTDSLYPKLFTEAAKELPAIITGYAGGKIIPIPQDDSKATFTKRLSKEDGFVPWKELLEAMEGKEPVKILRNFPGKGAEGLERKIRAFTPWPGVWTKIGIRNQESLRLRSGFTPKVHFRTSLQCELPEGQAGIMEEKRLKVLSAHIEPKTKDTRLKTKLVIDTVQMEGKQPVTWQQFKEGYPSLFTS